jgi:hypothetical protein
MMIAKKAPKFVAVFFLLLAWMGIFSSEASAQILDDISIREEKDNVVVIIKLTSPVHYLRHFPSKRGRILDIYYDILPGASTTNLFEENEMRKSPPSDLISSFTVSSNLENNQNELVIKFSGEVEYSVSAGNDNQSFFIFIPKSHVGLKTGLQDFPEVEQLPGDQAAGLMAEGRDALQASNNIAAIEAFNKLLQLPANKYTQDAQEWVGVARERAGQTDKARLEYESYLKLYTSGESVERVKERLASQPAPAQAAEVQPVKEKKAAQTSTWGSLSMHYYHGASNNDTTTTVGSTLNQSAFAATDQSSLITDFDVSERYRSETYDNRMVLRDSFTKNYLAGQPSKNKLTNAYFELKNKVADFSGRIGRQSATGGGVMGRFDGALLGYGFRPEWRANAVAGRLVDFTSQATQPIFYGAKLDVVGASGEGWSGSVYGINQTIDSIADRRAVGAELRYFEVSKTAFTLVDYDTIYKVVNTAMLQGTINAESGTTYNFLVDHRKSPSISSRNALNGSTTSSVSALLQNTTSDNLRALAKARTATANLVQIGATHQVSEKWQVGADAKVSNISGMPASGATELEGILPATPGTGNETTLTAQAIGSNIFSVQDISVFSLSRVKSPALNGLSFFISNRSTVARWTFDTTLRLYRDNNVSGISNTRTSPTLKLTYQKIKDKLNFEAEGGLEATDTSGNGTSSKTTRKFFSLGFRWDY